MTQKTEPSPEDLTRERHLYDLFVVARKNRPSRYARVLKYLMAAALAGFAIGATWLPGGLQTVLRLVREWADAGLGFASQIVGFLLAGFTIFATMNAKEFTLALARTREEKTGESYLKYIYVAYIRVFAVYLLLIAVCLAVKLLGAVGGPAAVALGLLPGGAASVVRSLVGRSALVLLGSLFWFVVVDLFGFVFDVYHTVMAGVRWEYEAQLEREKREREAGTLPPAG